MCVLNAKYDRLILQLEIIFYIILFIYCLILSETNEYQMLFDTFTLPFIAYWSREAPTV